jgi:hypothetical protein
MELFGYARELHLWLTRDPRRKLLYLPRQFIVDPNMPMQSCVPITQREIVWVALFCYGKKSVKVVPKNGDDGVIGRSLF